MAEALASLSLAASIVQFVGFALQLVKTSREIYKSTADARDEHAALGAIAAETRRMGLKINIATASAGSLPSLLQPLALQSVKILREALRCSRETQGQGQSLAVV